MVGFCGFGVKSKFKFTANHVTYCFLSTRQTQCMSFYDGNTRTTISDNIYGTLHRVMETNTSRSVKKIKEEVHGP